MKILLSIVFLYASIVVQAQINQRTIELHQRLSKIARYYPKENSLYSFQFSPIARELKAKENAMSAERSFKPSTHSIEKAFDYYNGIRKSPDYSGFLLMGYSLINKQQYIIGNTPEEPIRFFPANSKD